MNNLILQIYKIVEHQACRSIAIRTIKIKETIFQIKRFCAVISIYSHETTTSFIIKEKVSFHKVKEDRPYMFPLNLLAQCETA